MTDAGMVQQTMGCTSFDKGQLKHVVCNTCTGTKARLTPSSIIVPWIVSAELVQLCLFGWFCNAQMEGWKRKDAMWYWRKKHMEPVLILTSMCF